MPNRKPQVMWMAKKPDGELFLGYCETTRQRVIQKFDGNNYPNAWRPYWYKKGWRVVKVEVRETKKGKTK